LGGLVAATAVTLAVVAFRSEEFARRLDQARANRDERAKLQQEADLVICRANWSVGNQVEPGIELAKQLTVHAKNGRGYMVTNMTCRIPQIGGERIKLADLLPPAEVAVLTLDLASPFRVSEDNRELYESAEFEFSLGGVKWSGRYAQSAARSDPS
jgi:hypothetical protein